MLPTPAMNQFRSSWMRVPVGGLSWSGDYRPHDAAGDVSEPKIASVITVGQFLVIEAEQMQQGGVKIIDANLINRRFMADFVSGTVVNAGFYATACQPDGIGVRVVIAAGFVTRL